jgi:hypothetical protein
LGEDEYSTMTCDRCNADVRILGIEPHPTVESADLHTYLCDLCDAVKTRIVQRRP